MRRQEREEEEEEGKGNKSFTRSNDGQGIRMTRGRVILKKVFKKREGTVPPSFSLRFIMKGCNSRKYPYWDSSLNPWLAGRLRLKKGETKGIFLFLLLFPPFIQEQERCLSSGPPFKKMSLRPTTSSAYVLPPTPLLQHTFPLLLRSHILS